MCTVLSQLQARGEAQEALKSADSIKRFTYLLGQTDLFKHFCDLKVRTEPLRYLRSPLLTRVSLSQAQRDPTFAKLLAEAENAGKAKGRYVPPLRFLIVTTLTKRGATDEARRRSPAAASRRRRRTTSFSRRRRARTGLPKATVPSSSPSLPRVRQQCACPPPLRAAADGRYPCC